MHEPRKTVVNKSNIKLQLLLRYLFFFIRLRHFLILLHQVHKWCYNLIKTLLVLDIIVFAILCENEFNHVFVEFFLPSGPLGISPHHSLIFHVTNRQLNLLVILDIVGVTAGILAPVIHR